MAIDGLLYTNNSIMTIINRLTPYAGQMLVNGALVSADLGMLVPSIPSKSTMGTTQNLPVGRPNDKFQFPVECITECYVQYEPRNR